MDARDFHRALRILTSIDGDELGKILAPYSFDSLFDDYRSTDLGEMGCIYASVPVGVVAQVIEKHGGLVGPVEDGESK